MTETIKLHEPYFTHKEVLSITGIADRTLLIWKQRGVIEFFQDSFTEHRGRRLFAPIDVFFVGVLDQIVKGTKAPPSAYAGAVKVALSDLTTSYQHSTFKDLYRHLDHSEEEVNALVEQRKQNSTSIAFGLIDGFMETWLCKSGQSDGFPMVHVEVPIDHLIHQMRETMREQFEAEIE